MIRKFIVFFSDKVMSIDSGNGARGKVEKKTREKQRPGGYWRQRDKMD